MIVRVKTKKRIFDKGNVQTFSRYIYQIIEKKGQNNPLKNLSTEQELKRTYIDEELDQTFDQPEAKKPKKKPSAKPKLNTKEMIA